ncbi:GTPase [Solibacillus sp. FSL H8-0538]|uniref:GTPase n=1 Tax=Solibacillus sp. FSL H8-0538 TaxID=2921400 RepID=UPI0030F89540
MNIQVTNKMLNLASLQSKMDETVFDYVDTTKNWQKAYSILDDLLHQMVNFFNQYVEKNAGELPKSNPYWVLFMDIASRLVYFNGLTHAQLIDLQDEGAKNHIVNLYKKSATCLPNAKLEQNEQFLQELTVSLQEIAPEEDRATMNVSLGCTMKECMESFYSLCKTYE